MQLFSKLIPTLLLVFGLTATSIIAQNIPSSTDKITPLLIGATIPDVSLKTTAGETVKLRELASERPTVLVFYRGGWCPYCSRHMMDLQKIEKDLVALGYQVLAVSPDRPEELSKSIDKGDLKYQLLSDSPMDVTKAFGIAYKLDDKTVARYKENGIDLEVSSGYKHHLLPAPAVFILNQEGKIRFSYVNPDYKERIDGDVLLTAAKAYK